MKKIVPLFLFSILFLIPIGTQSAFAGVIIGASQGGDPAPIGYIENEGLFEISEDVFYCPTCPPWLKHLLLDSFVSDPLFGRDVDDDPTNDAATGLTTDFTLRETIVLTTPQGAELVDWHDWHERLTPISQNEGFEFTQVSAEVQGNPVPATISQDGKEIDIIIEPPMMEGQELFIEKTITFLGADRQLNTGDTKFVEFIEVEQFPTINGGDGNGEMVGGEIIPIETFSLLLAGLETNYSILTALVAVGSVAFGVMYTISKRK